MSRKHRPDVGSTWFAIVIGLMVVGLGMPRHTVAEYTETIHVSDTRGAPGEVVEVMVSTYAPRGVEEGQICLTATSTKTSETPFAVLEDVVVESSEGDAEVTSSLEDGEVVISFYSPSRTINEVEGPLVTLYLRLSEHLKQGDKFTLALNPEATFVVDYEGYELPLEFDSGKLKIRRNKYDN
jgi:hypothetical protein